MNRGNVRCMKVLVIGANGKTGLRVVTQLVAHSEHSPVAMIRDREQAARFESMGVGWTLGDLEHPIDDAVRGCDAIIFAAGSGGKTGKDKTVLIDHLGAIRSMVTALQMGARRYIMLSGLNVDRDYAGDRIPHWRRAKGRADQFLRSMPTVFDGEGLDYSIVCPGKLHDAESVSGVTLISPDGEGNTDRAQLAATLVGCLDAPATIGATFGVVDGTIPVVEALKQTPAH